MIKQIEILNKDTLLVNITFIENSNIAHIMNISGKKNPWLIYISKNEKEYDISICDVIKFLETRCVPKTRENIEELLSKKYHLKEYSSIGICKQTHGVSNNDNIWLRFNSEELRFDDVRVR